MGGVGFRPDDPITFKSGIESPVYCDNRRFPFWPEQWAKVIEAFAELIAEHGIAFDVVGGIEAAGFRTARRWDSAMRSLRSSSAKKPKSTARRSASKAAM